MMSEPSSFRVGDRVRYKYGRRDTGIIVRRLAQNAKYGDWMIRWDHDPHGPRTLSAWEDNIEPERASLEAFHG